MEEGRGINIAWFGTFTFDALRTDGNPRNLNGQGIRLKPCFLPSKELRRSLRQVENKDCLSHHVCGSIYQQGIRMSYLNPVPIAQGVYFKNDFVRSATDTLFKGIVNLFQRGYNLEIEFDQIATVRLIDRNLKTTFASGLAENTRRIEQIYPLKNVNASLSVILPDSVGENISRVHAIRHCRHETGLQRLERPDSSMLKDIKSRIEKLSESSKDLCNIHVICFQFACDLQRAFLS
jgi:hypothetical protein